MFKGEQLDAALYNATDLLGRCLLKYIMLKDTARDIKAGPEILHEATGIYIGIAKAEVTPEVLSNLRTFSKNTDLHYGMEDYHETTKYNHLISIEWKHQGVPIIITIMQNKYPFFDRPDRKMYRLEEYLIPNPFDEYWRIRGIIE